MLNSYELRAFNSATSINRFYNIHIGETLFNELYLHILHGRCGFKGRERFYYFKDEYSLEKKLKEILKRRYTAKNRIGVNYKSAL